MWDGFIGREIRRANRNLLIANVCLLLCVGGVLGYNAKYLRSWFGGCVPMDPASVGKLHSPNDLDRTFVTLDVCTMIETGYQEIETNDAGKQTGVNADFQMVPVGDRALIVRTGPGAIGTHLSGQLTEAPKEVF